MAVTVIVAAVVAMVVVVVGSIWSDHILLTFFSTGKTPERLVTTPETRMRLFKSP